MKEAKANEVRDRPEYKELENEIKFFNRFAWALVIVGAISLAIISGKLIFGNPGWAQTLGDFTGGVVASFWSLAGIMFVYIAFLGQKQQLMLQEEELRLNREEMIATRKEIEGQKVQLEEQSKTAALQRFENTFFSLIDDFERGVNNIKLDNNISYKVFTSMFNIFNLNLSEERRLNKDTPEQILIERSFSKLINVIKKGNNELEPLSFLINFYIILEHTIHAKISNETKCYYCRLLLVKSRGSITKLLIYRAIARNENPQKMLLCRWLYNVSKDGPNTLLIDKELHSPLIHIPNDSEV